MTDNKIGHQNKVLLIGIDGGSWTLLNIAIKEGYMPYLKSLVEAGAVGILKSTKPAITPAAWSSFRTGVNPGKTGVFDFLLWDKQKRESIPVSSHLLKKTIWKTVSESKKKVGIINVPMTYPPQPINGSVVTGILTPAMRSEFTYPSELKSNLLKAVPDYHIFNIENVVDLTKRGSGDPP